jgi:hypothetical protein
LQLANVIVVKVTYENEIRRFEFNFPLIFDDVYVAVLGRFGLQSRNCRLHYQDDEGDLITVSSDSELRYAMNVRPSAPLRLILSLSEVLPDFMDVQTASVQQKIPVALEDSAFSLAQPANLARDTLVPASDLNVVNSQCIDTSNLFGFQHDTEDMELAKRLQQAELQSADQEAADLEYARRIQAEEFSHANNNVSVFGAAVLGAGIGLFVGGCFGAATGAAIAAVSASDGGRHKLGEFVRSAGHAATDAGRRIVQKSEPHCQRVRLGAQTVLARASDAHARARAAAQDALAQVREVNVNAVVPMAVGAVSGGAAAGSRLAGAGAARNQQGGIGAGSRKRSPGVGSVLSKEIN